LINSFQSFVVIALELFGDKSVPALAGGFALGLEIRTGQAAGELLVKIVADKVNAMGLRDQPAPQIDFAVSRAENIGTLQQFPAWLRSGGIALLRGDVNEVTCEQ
ncbi:MAG: hypothetical protein WAK95_00005, partial [Desulfobacterales bacterium]